MDPPFAGPNDTGMKWRMDPRLAGLNVMSGGHMNDRMISENDGTIYD